MAGLQSRKMNIGSTVPTLQLTGVSPVGLPWRCLVGIILISANTRFF